MISLRQALFAIVAIFPSSICGQQGDGFPGVEQQVGSCLYCQIAVAHVMMADRVANSLYRCITDEAQEGDGESEMFYSINLPTAFVNAHNITLDSGLSTICIIGGSAVRTEFGKPDYVVLPSNPNIYFVASRASRQRRLAQTGTRTVLFVRVTAPNSLQSNTDATLAAETFGTGSQKNSMRSQYIACSAGRLSFVAASGNAKISNGVITISLPSTVNSANIFNLENSVKTAVKDALVVSDLGTSFSNIMVCMPYGTTLSGQKDWLAYAYVNGQYSYFNNAWCSSLSAKIHEVGHNLGLRHSSEDGIEYSDKSCMMGYSYVGTQWPLMCFNGHKNYILGWYFDKQITINPSTSGAKSVKLVGFVNYSDALITRNEYVLIIVGELYIQFNLAVGFNSDVMEKPNMVTITTAPSTSSMSTLQGAIVVQQTFVIGSYSIDACKLVVATSSIPSYMILSIRLNTQTSTCPSTTPTVILTAKPTVKPTAVPTSVPTRKPTARPTAVPTSVSTAKPTVKPTAVPTSVSTAKPTVKPTAVPTSVSTAKPTVKPTAVPTSASTTTPTVKPTAVPTIVSTANPTVKPTAVPTIVSTAKPTEKPIAVPTIVSTTKPIITPTAVPTTVSTAKPTVKPTAVTTIVSTTKPIITPTAAPTSVSTANPTFKPTAKPTNKKPTKNRPTSKPTAIPTLMPTTTPITATPTFMPSVTPTFMPTVTPTFMPTVTPTFMPTVIPTFIPTVIPTTPPTAEPTTTWPSTNPTDEPTDSIVTSVLPV